MRIIVYIKKCTYKTTLDTMEVEYKYFFITMKITMEGLFKPKLWSYTKFSHIQIVYIIKTTIYGLIQNYS
jgi:hypothetical protein